MKINEKYHSINYVLPTEDLEDLMTIKNKYNVIENYDFKEIAEKYFLNNYIIALIFKNGEEVRILSKIITKDKTIIKNNLCINYINRERAKEHFEHVFI